MTVKMLVVYTARSSRRMPAPARRITVARAQARDDYTRGNRAAGLIAELRPVVPAGLGSSVFAGQRIMGDAAPRLREPGKRVQDLP